MQKLTPHLWFDNQAEEAVAHYTGIFPDSRVAGVQRYGEAGPGEAGTVMTVTFELAGQRFTALNGGPGAAFCEAVSLHVDCADQAEVDFYWDKLGEGGQEGRCGWLKDRFGLSWQIVPKVVPQLLADPDPARSERAMKAMLGMHKLDVQALTDAADDR